MVDTAHVINIHVEPVEISTVANSNFISAIGHADTAVVVGNILGKEVACNRCTVSLTEGDVLFVAQYKGPRLPEGATELPDGATIEFLRVTID